MKGSRNTSGFILLDMLVSLPILVFLLAAMGAMAVMAFRAAFFMMADSELQQEVQMAVRQVAEDARTSYAIRGFTKDEKPGYTFISTARRMKLPRVRSARNTGSIRWGLWTSSSGRMRCVR